MATIFAAAADNVLEIGYSQLTKSSLVSNIEGTRIYATNTLWGHFWSWFYSIESLFKKEAHREEKTASIINEAESIFLKQILSLRSDIELYKDHIIRGNIKAAKINQVKKRLIVAAEKLQLLQSRTFFNPRSEEFFPILNSINYEDIEKTCRLREIIEVETVTGSPWPLNILNKLIFDKKLTAIEKHQLKNWIKRLNPKVTGASASVIHKALLTLSKEGAIGKGIIEDIGHLEYRLIEEGCKALTRKDSEHLKEKKEIFCNGKKCKISPTEELYDKLKGFDIDWEPYNFIDWKPPRFIDLEPYKLVLIGDNPASVHIYKFLNSTAWGVKPPEIYAIDKDGLCAIVEGLKKPLRNRTWQQPLSDKDLRFAKAFIKLLRSFINENSSPREAFLNDLYYNRQYQLKTKNRMEKDKFNYNLLEESVHQIAAGNKEIYKHIMSESGLKEHPINQFYNEMVKNTLFLDKKTDIDDQAAFKEIKDKKVIKRAKHLCEQTKNLYRRCTQHLKIFEEDSLGVEWIKENIFELIEHHPGLIEQITVDDVLNSPK